jgi:hypothetical protein
VTEQASSATATLLNSVAALISAIAWPAVAAWFLFTHRSGVADLLKIFATKVSSARKVKFGELELEEQLEAGIREVRESAGAGDPPKSVPEEQIQAAVDLKARIRTADVPRNTLIETIRRQINDLAEEYEATRARMPSGTLRTRRMNEIAAGMRALALAALPLRQELSKSQSSGQRLAAICILQVSPSASFFDWLIERVKKESEPFVFYQAAVAILELVRQEIYSDANAARAAIKDAINAISSFKGGKPDRNTLDVLNEALFLVR